MDNKEFVLSIFPGAICRRYHRPHSNLFQIATLHWETCGCNTEELAWKEMAACIKHEMISKLEE